MHIVSWGTKEVAAPVRKAKGKKKEANEGFGDSKNKRPKMWLKLLLVFEVI